MRRVVLAGLAIAVAQCLAAPAAAQQRFSAEPRIAWEVKNRFRLFRHESDFEKHAAAHRAGSIFAAEQALARDTLGRGWARLMMNGLCVDGAGGLQERCERDGVAESYLSPVDFSVRVRLENAPAGATCAWAFDDGQQATQTVTAPCAEEVRLRVRAALTTQAAVDITAADGTAAQATADIEVRNLLIAGIGDSIASGEGNPDRAIALSDEGFCFRRLGGTVRSDYFRPGRAGYRGNKTCETAPRDVKTDVDWNQRRANWQSAACHRSLYSYQLRTALALAIENPQVAVTFVPLACTGASIASGLFGAQPAREIACRGQAANCPSSVPSQISQLQATLAKARRAQGNDRTYDLILMSIGANDIRFSDLVAHVMLDNSFEHGLMTRAGLTTTVDEARAILQSRLPTDFAKLRAALKPLVGGDLSHVVHVGYANPATDANGATCPGGRAGVDVHPAFNINAGRLQEAAKFVETAFLPRLKALARCEGSVLCGDTADRMTYVDAHQRAFAGHGFCARAETDPTFDQECFSAEGDSFQDSAVEGVKKPLACPHSVREFRPYAPRARWVRTANDSYFAAMTYPDGVSSTLRPTDLHDAVWGILSAVYGGAIHPTAEGHAVMADAALAAARGVLGLSPPRAAVIAEPLPAPSAGQRDSYP